MGPQNITTRVTANWQCLPTEASLNRGIEIDQMKEHGKEDFTFSQSREGILFFLQSAIRGSKACRLLTTLLGA